MKAIHQSPPRCVACGQLQGEPHAVGCRLAWYTICGFCANYTRKDAEPQYTALGMGRCHGYDQDANSPVRYVAWNETCVLFDKDKDRDAAASRRRFVEKCQLEREGE